MSRTIKAFTIAILTLLGNVGPTLGQQTVFSYTGYLLDSGSPANGSNDLQFTLYATPTNGAPLTTGVTLTNQPVNNGVFVVSLDFGGTVFDGGARWLEISTRPGGSVNPFTNTFPRQKISAAPYAVYANNGVPPGSVMAYMGATPPTGWLLCDGSAISRSTYAALFSVISTYNGPGDGSTTFNLPDMRGMFLRGVNGSRADIYADPLDNRVSPPAGGNNGNNVGSVQADAIRTHTHTMGINGTDTSAMVAGGASQRLAHFSSDGYGGGAKKVTDNQNVSGAAESRPKNIYVNYIIKY